MPTDRATKARRGPTAEDRATAWLIRQKASAKSADDLMQEAKLGVGPTAEAAILRRLTEMPVTCRQNYLKAMSGKSVTAGVKAYCMECLGHDRSSVRRCTDLGCPLFPYRPFTN